MLANFVVDGRDALCPAEKDASRVATMNIQVPKMDMLHLRGWVDLLDRATLVALVVATIAIVTAGATTWLSFKYRAAGMPDIDDFNRSKLEAVNHAKELQNEIDSVRERSAQLERAIVQANERTAAAREQIVELESTIESAKAHAAAGRKDAGNPEPGSEQGRSAGQQAKAPITTRGGQQHQTVGSLTKFTGMKAAVYALDEAPDALEAGSSINAMLAEAGWVSSMWKWTGVSGIVGVVVLTKEGIDPSIDQAAATTVEGFRSAGFNAARASWPRDADWRKFRGTLSGPQSPDPTEAPIRIVVGAKSSLNSR